MSNSPNNILNARKNSGRSQKEVAITLGVSSPTVSDWERQKKYPTVENLKMLADLFCVSTDYLLQRTNAPDLGRKPTNEWDGDILKTLREEADESEAFVAEAIGISVSLYRNYENSSAEPNLCDLCRLAEHFCTDVDILLKRYFYLTRDDKITVDNFNISKPEQHLIECFRLASEKEQEIIWGILREYQEKRSTAQELA